MADFERKLTSLAERGTRVGPEEMIERVEARMAEDPLVVATKQRKGWAMTSNTDDDRTARRGSPRPGWTWAVAAFVIVIALGGLYLVLDEGGGGDEGELVSPAPTTTVTARQSTVPEAAPTTVAPTTTATSDMERFEARKAVVHALVEARNSGDYDAWRAFFLEDRPTIFGGIVEDESELEWQRSYVAANDVWTVTGDCVDQAVAVTCPMTLVNEFFGPAGIFYTVPDMHILFRPDDAMFGINANHWEIAGDTEESTPATTSGRSGIPASVPGSGMTRRSTG